MCLCVGLKRKFLQFALFIFNLIVFYVCRKRRSFFIVYNSAVHTVKTAYSIARVRLCLKSPKKSCCCIEISPLIFINRNNNNKRRKNLPCSYQSCIFFIFFVWTIYVLCFLKHTHIQTSDRPSIIQSYSSYLYILFCSSY